MTRVRRIVDAPGASWRPHRRPGITLVEVLAATVLATILLGSILGVVQSLERQRRAVQRLHPDEAWLRRLEAQLRHDVANSRWMRSEPAQLTLVGYGGHDPQTGRPTWRPTEVRYVVETRPEGMAELWRWERPLDEWTNRRARGEYCAEGLSRVLLGRDDGFDTLSAVVTADGPRDLHAVPPRLICVLMNPAGETLHEFRIVQDSLR
jgi:hypothetical protein